MFTLEGAEMWFIALVLQGFFYGLYSGIFAMYLRIHTSRKDCNKMQNIIFYSICALYVLSIVVFTDDIATALNKFFGKPADSLLRDEIIQMICFGCSDFIAQFILIYRCWIMWDYKFRVVIIPTFLAFAFLGTWLAGWKSAYVFLNHIKTPHWAGLVISTGFALSMTVNALVTALIVFRIVKEFREVQATWDDRIVPCATGGNKLRSIIFILIQSGMLLFSIQLARLVVTVMRTNIRAFIIIGGIQNMLNGITPTIILVCTSMGLSCNDDKSEEEVAIGSLCFAPAPNHPNPVPEIGSSIAVDGQDGREDDIIEVQRSNDIDVVDR